MGIASFVIGVIAWIPQLLMLTLEIPEAFFFDGLIVFFLLIIPADIVAVGLGIAGVVQSKKKKIFAILGTILSCCYLVFIALV